MRQKSGKLKEPAEKVVRDIRRATRNQYSAERGDIGPDIGLDMVGFRCAGDPMP